MILIFYQNLFKFPVLSLCFSHFFSNSLSFPCLELLLNMFPVFPVQWEPWHGSVALLNALLQQKYNIIINYPVIEPVNCIELRTAGKCVKLLRVNQLIAIKLYHRVNGYI